MNRWVFYALLCGMIQTASAADLMLIVTGVANSGGVVIADLYNDKTAFEAADDVANPYRRIKLPANEGEMKFDFLDLEQGQYAFAILHDVNGDEILNRQLFPFIGMPSEAYVFSNNAFNMFSQADYEDAVFSVGVENLKITLELSQHYKKMIAGKW